jgi:hypothetical protein
MGKTRSHSKSNFLVLLTNIKLVLKGLPSAKDKYYTLLGLIVSDEEQGFIAFFTVANFVKLFSSSQWPNKLLKG